MCETIVIKCDKCRFIDSKWLMRCEARLAEVPCFQFDTEIGTQEGFDQECEYCRAMVPAGQDRYEVFHFLDLGDWPDC